MTAPRYPMPTNGRVTLPDPDFPILNCHERAILRRLWEGEHLRTIAQSRQIAYTTARRFKRRLLDLAGAETDLGLIHFALRKRWIDF